MFRYKEFLKESNKPVDEYKIIQTTGLSGGQKPVSKPEDDYKPIKTSGLSGGQKPRKPKSQIYINPIKEDIGNVKPRQQVTKHQETDPDVLFSNDIHHNESNKFINDYKEKHGKSYLKDNEAFNEYHEKFGKREKLMEKIGRHSRGYEHFGNNPTEENYRKLYAIQRYSASSYSLNSYLHEKEEGKADPYDSQLNEERVANLDEALARQKAPNDMYVYTGLKGKLEQNNRNGIKGLNKADDHIKARLPAFTSTSMHPTIALDFAQHVDSEGDLKDKDGNYQTEHHILKIKIPKGSEHGMYIGHMSKYPHEHEFLLKRNRKLHIHPEPEVHSYVRDNGFGEKIKKTVHVWHGHLVDDDNA